MAVEFLARALYIRIMPEQIITETPCHPPAHESASGEGVRGNIREFWHEWRTLILFLVVMMIFRSAIADWHPVPTGSMKPTIIEGDRVVVNKLAYDLKLPFTTWHLAEWSEPQRGDIITFYSPKDEQRLIKRVIGVPGDVVELQNNQLYLNGTGASYGELDPAIANQLDINLRRYNQLLVEQVDGLAYPVMVDKKRSYARSNLAPLPVPQGFYLVLGDNRDNSADSRMIGLIARDRITGRAHTVAFSVDYEDYYLPRKNRFIHSLTYHNPDELNRVEPTQH